VRRCKRGRGRERRTRTRTIGEAEEASRKSHTRVVAMLTRLIDRFDADGTRHRGSWFPSSASPIVLVLVVVLVLDLSASAKAGAFHFERNDITIICGTLRLKPWAELFCPFGTGDLVFFPYVTRMCSVRPSGAHPCSSEAAHQPATAEVDRSSQC
jgi:hypothetical protein